MFENEKVIAIIVAAGKSERMAGIDKIFALIGNRPVLTRSVYPFECSTFVDRIIILLNAHNLEQGKKLAYDEKWRKVTHIIVGGERRQDTVKAGLALIADAGWVLIHDGARPLVSVELIEDGLNAALDSGASAPGIPVADTIKVIDDHGFVLNTPDRQKLLAAQTPQVFRAGIISRAYAWSNENASDDAMLVEKLGIKVKIYPGSYGNIKISTPESLATAELIWRKRGD